MAQLQLSARAYHRVLAHTAGAGKLARQLAHLAGRDGIQPAHLREALQYQPRLGRLGERTHPRAREKTGEDWSRKTGGKYKESLYNYL
jgi:hypothetical protein